MYRFIVFAAVLWVSSLTGWAQNEIDPEPLPDHLFQAPAIRPLPPKSIDVYPNGYQVVGGSFVSETSYPLLRALEAAEPIYAANPGTIVLEVHGNIPANLGQQLGGGDAGIKAYRMYWQNFAMNVAIVGATGPSVDVIQGFTIKKNLSNGTVTPGVRLLRIENLAVRTHAVGNMPISTPFGLPPTVNNGYPILQIYGCVLERGTGNPKWGVRLHGRARFDFRNNHFQYYVEHCAYIDSPQGDSYFINNTMDGTKRTMIQVVSRSSNPGPCGYGRLLIQDNIATLIDGDGGSDFTVVSHQGPVILRGNQSIQAPGQAGAQGSIVVWTDTGNGYCGATCASTGLTTSTEKVIIQDHIVNHPNADRDHIAISGACAVEFRDGFSITGNKPAIHFNSPYGGPLANGNECFHIPGFTSTYAGFQSYAKVKRANVTLTNPQIDALYCP